MPHHETNLEASYKQLYRPLCNYFLKQGIPPSDIEDCTQEVFSRALAGHFEGRSQFNTFLFGIAKNLVREHRAERGRDQRLRQELAVFAQVEDPGEPFITEAHHRILMEVFRNLPPETREIIEIKHYEDPSISYKEIAARLGMTEGAVKQRFYRFREDLKKALRDRGLF